jgi:hypothetical protein
VGGGSFASPNTATNAKYPLNMFYGVTVLEGEAKKCMFT